MSISYKNQFSLSFLFIFSWFLILIMFVYQLSHWFLLFIAGTCPGSSIRREGTNDCYLAFLQPEDASTWSEANDLALARGGVILSVR